VIIKHQHFDLLGKKVLERVIFTPPLKAFGHLENEACFLYAVNGESTLYGGNEKYKLSTNQSVLIKCGSYLYSWHENVSETPNESIVIHLYPDVLKLVYNDNVPNFLKNKKRLNPKHFQKVDSEEVIKNYFNTLLFYFENPELVNEDLTTLKIKELIILLYNFDSHGIRDILHDLFNPHQIDFKEIIYTSLFEDLSVEDIAQLTNLSLSSFKRKFKQTFDESPARYIKLKRLEKAADLLKVSRSRITDICYDCGFNDLGQFSKSFTAKYGYSPTEYRKMHLG